MDNNLLEIIDVMIDIESLGKKPGCKILSIGCHRFDGFESFYAKANNIDQDSLVADPDTVAWWAKQGEDARLVFDNAGSLALSTVLFRLSEWIQRQQKQAKQVRVWGNAASFDLKIIEAAYEVYKMPVPWSYRDEMCYRTLKNLFRWIEPSEFKGTKHNALHDAMHQAEHANYIMEHVAKYNAHLDSVKGQ